MPLMGTAVLCGPIHVCHQARQRRRKLTIIHKSNILTVTDGLFRECCYWVRHRTCHHQRTGTGEDGGVASAFFAWAIFFFRSSS